MQGKWMQAGLMALALASAAGAPAMAEITQATVTGGKIEGVAKDGLGEFKGIPFAAPPVGDLRWKGPQPVASWSGVKQTTAFGNACMQSGGGGGAGPGVAYSEDCLYLNVWTPAHAPGEKLAVIVWIYGGAYVGGATSNALYDGTHFAQKGVVFVSVGYRVGAFAFLATPELSKESGHGSGTYGIQDQIAGLKWVKDNIAKFGGDPSKVTILGHSAGGFSVSMLAGSPLAKGLFRGVISESGGNFHPPQDASWTGSNITTLPVAEAAGQAWFDKLGVHSLAEARAIPAEKVLDDAKGGPRFWPPVDGYVDVGDQTTLWKQGRFNDTAVIIGDVSDEAAAFGVRKTTAAAFQAQVRKTYGSKADAILAAYPASNDEEATRSATELGSDNTFDWGQYAWARQQSLHGKGKVYFYWFDKPTARDPNGSTHGTEVAYVFGNLGAGGRAQPTDEDKAISDQMQTYWVNFAKTLDPNGAGLPHWPDFTAAKPTVMRFGVNPGPAPDPIQARLTVLDSYYDWRRDGSK
jgi:para-nitrobenzyl esterase